MTGQFGRNADALAGASARFAWTGDDLGRAAGGPRAALTALGDVCGGDEQGHAFAERDAAGAHGFEGPPP